jgi:hypothetical protein
MNKSESESESKMCIKLVKFITSNFKLRDNPSVGTESFHAERQIRQS